MQTPTMCRNCNNSNISFFEYLTVKTDQLEKVDVWGLVHTGYVIDNKDRKHNKKSNTTVFHETETWKQLNPHR